ncbi:DNA translocase FtsK 4TM domain-containing protein, partial [Vibrio makurazakiensis]|uniref:DNA translocase FtsK 4TM domain-containing protein n=1 Tax=Vibrio makurazakiensis TaxID=2910250 RepID=UPI003D09E4EE
MFRESNNKVETIIKTSEEPQSSRLNGVQRLKECSLILSILSSILLTVALLTYSPADPSWSQTSWGVEIQNAGGHIGAWLADTLFFTFGSLAYPLPILVTIAAWVLFRKREENEQIDFMLWGTRLLGLTILIITSCGLADINFDDIWYFSSGGVVGDVITSLALPTLNVLGSTLVLLFLWGAGFTLLTGISWLSIVEWLGEGAIKLFTLLLNRIRGEEKEVLEPQLKEFEEPKFDLPEPASPLEAEHNLNHPSVESNTHVVDVPTEPQQPLDSTGDEYQTPIVEPTKPKTRHYNIHMPEAVIEPAPFASVDIEEPTVDRSKQLNATIEELETSALYEDDFAQQGTSQEPQQANESAELYQEYLQQSEHDDLYKEPAQSQVFDQEPQENRQSACAESAVPVEQPEVQVVAPELEQPRFEQEVATSMNFEVEAESSMGVQPTIFEVGLEQIESETDVTLGEHIEPTISSFDPVENSNEFDDRKSSTDDNQYDHFEPDQSEVEEVKAEIPSDLPWEEVTQQAVEQESSANEIASEDKDVAAFQSLVSDAQANMAATQNPFLVQQNVNLPKPEEPLPTLELLFHPEKRETFIDREALEDIARLVESKLADYKIKAEVVDIFPGPVITRFELDLAPGVKVSRISGLSMDLARSLSAMAVRVVEVIPGKPYIGLEPNMSRQTVFFSDVVGSKAFQEATSPTTVVLGQDIAGEAVIADLSKMPHVLVAGTTGSGKSVGVNVMILSMLYKASP